MSPPLTKDERAAKENTVVRVCANGHGVLLYYARRDQPEPPCPACAAAKREQP